MKKILQKLFRTIKLHPYLALGVVLLLVPAIVAIAAMWILIFVTHPFVGSVFATIIFLVAGLACLGRFADFFDKGK